MFKVLNVTDDITHCGHCGHIVEDFRLMCEYAAKYAFAGVNLKFENNNAYSTEEMQSILSGYKLRPAAFGFTAEIFNPDEKLYQKSLEEFCRHAMQAKELDCTTALCYIPPYSREIDFYTLFRIVSDRLHLLKPFLIESGVKIGFEFIGPTQTRVDTLYDFIHTIDGTRALIAAAGIEQSAGFKLDSHHWQFSGATLIDLEHLAVEEILYVEVNDSLPGFGLADMPEFERELPFVTGNTRLAEFLQVLARKNYSGPIAAEPWSQRVRNMEPDTAFMEIKNSLDKCISISKK